MGERDRGGGVGAAQAEARGRVRTARQAHHERSASARAGLAVRLLLRVRNGRRTPGTVPGRHGVGRTAGRLAQGERPGQRL